MGRLAAPVGAGSQLRGRVELLAYRRRLGVELHGAALERQAELEAGGQGMHRVETVVADRLPALAARRVDIDLVARLLDAYAEVAALEFRFLHGGRNHVLEALDFRVAAAIAAEGADRQHAKRRQDRDDHDHDHDLEQREATLRADPVGAT